MLVKHQDWSSGSAGGRACFLYSSLGIAGLYNDMIGGHYVSDVSRIVLPLFVSLWLEDICLILPWMRYLLCAGARVISFYRVMHAGSQLCFSHLARSWLGFVSGPHTSLPQGAFTPDANKSRYSHVVGRLNILSLLASFAREIRFIRAWNSLHNRCEFASWEGLLPGSSSLVAKFIPVFVKVRSSIVQLQVSTYNHNKFVLHCFFGFSASARNHVTARASSWLVYAVRISAKVHIFQLACQTPQTLNLHRAIRAAGLSIASLHWLNM